MKQLSCTFYLSITVQSNLSRPVDDDADSAYVVSTSIGNPVSVLKFRTQVTLH